MTTGTREVRTLIRDVEAVRIPSGEKETLGRATDVVLMQSLGGTYTVWTDSGMFRIDGSDADAMGFETPTPQVSSPTSGSLEAQIWEQLKSCYDPEIPVNIVDLGLIYKLEVSTDGATARVAIDMTLTAPGCGMGDVLKSDVERKVRSLPGVSDLVVQMVFEPQWDQTRMSEAARLKLGYL